MKKRDGIEKRDAVKKRLLDVTFSGFLIVSLLGLAYLFVMANCIRDIIFRDK